MGSGRRCRSGGRYTYTTAASGCDRDRHVTGPTDGFAVDVTPWPASGRPSGRARGACATLIAGWGRWLADGSRRAACGRARHAMAASTLTTSTRPSLGWARGATSHDPQRDTFMQPRADRATIRGDRVGAPRRAPTRPGLRARRRPARPAACRADSDDTAHRCRRPPTVRTRSPRLDRRTGRARHRPPGRRPTCGVVRRLGEPVAGSRTTSPHGSPGLIVTSADRRRVATSAAPAERRPRRRGTPARRAGGRPAGVLVGATSADLAGQVDQLLHRRARSRHR